MEDQQLAGALMKVGNIPILWTVICVVFMKTALLQQREDRERAEVDPAGRRANPVPVGSGPAPGTAPPPASSSVP